MYESTLVTDEGTDRQQRRRKGALHRVAMEVIAKGAFTYETAAGYRAGSFEAALAYLKIQRPSLVCAVAYSLSTEEDDSRHHLCVLSFDMLCRMAAAAVVAHMCDILSKIPSYLHTCKHCTFLGVTRASSPKESHSVVDLYYCIFHDGQQSMLVIRYGNNKGDYRGLATATYPRRRKKSPFEAYFYEAFQRSTARGLQPAPLPT